MAEKSTKAAEPMDSNAPEISNPTLAPLNRRTAYALQTLVSEVHALYPELPGQYSDYDGRNTALAITFDLTVLDTDEIDILKSLMRCVEADIRVAEVLTDDDQVYVRLHSNPRTQDSRASFDLASAYAVLVEDDNQVTTPQSLDEAVEAEGSNLNDASTSGFGVAGFGE